MCLLKLTTAVNKFTCTETTKEDLEFLFTHLKKFDQKKADFDMRVTNYTKEMLITMYMNCENRWTWKYDGKLMFCCGLLPMKDNNSMGLFWMPSIHCETLKKSYARAALMAIEKIKAIGKKVYTYTPTWYTQNFRATLRLGFKPLGEVQLFGEIFRFSVLEAR